MLHSRIPIPISHLHHVLVLQFVRQTHALGHVLGAAPPHQGVVEVTLQGLGVMKDSSAYTNDVLFISSIYQGNQMS